MPQVLDYAAPPNANERRTALYAKLAARLGVAGVVGLILSLAAFAVARWVASDAEDLTSVITVTGVVGTLSLATIAASLLFGRHA